VPHIEVTDHLVQTLLSADTDRQTQSIICFTWATEMVGNKIQCMF